MKDLDDLVPIANTPDIARFMTHTFPQPYTRGKNIAGVMVTAIQQIIPLEFAACSINGIFARIFGPNIASQKTIEKAGFVLEGHFEKTIFSISMT